MSFEYLEEWNQIEGVCDDHTTARDTDVNMLAIFSGDNITLNIALNAVNDEGNQTWLYEREDNTVLAKFILDELNERCGYEWDAKFYTTDEDYKNTILGAIKTITDTIVIRARNVDNLGLLDIVIQHKSTERSSHDDRSLYRELNELQIEGISGFGAF